MIFDSKTANCGFNRLHIGEFDSDDHLVEIRVRLLNPVRFVDVTVRRREATGNTGNESA